jgi:phosphatidylglycerol---prolipoprotein diacylglyceryl transferase
MQIILDPVVFYIGSFSVRWYNIILAFALAVGFIILMVESKRLEFPRLKAIGIYMWSLLFVAIFARLFIYWDQWDYYSADPARMLTLTGARLDGAVFGFLLMILIYGRLSKYSFWYLGDLITMDMAICMALGRWACFVNGCCYGLPCDLPWAVTYTDLHSRAPLDIPLHPVQLYQIIWYSLVFIVLWALRKKLKPQGSLLLIFIILHASGDFVTRIFRDDNEFFLGLQQAQLFSVIMLAAAIPAYVIKLRRYRLSEHNAN